MRRLCFRRGTCNALTLLWETFLTGPQVAGSEGVAFQKLASLYSASPPCFKSLVEFFSIIGSSISVLLSQLSGLGFLLCNHAFLSRGFVALSHGFKFARAACRGSDFRVVVPSTLSALNNLSSLLFNSKNSNWLLLYVILQFLALSPHGSVILRGIPGWSYACSLMCVLQPDAYVDIEYKLGSVPTSGHFTRILQWIPLRGARARGFRNARSVREMWAGKCQASRE